ncbi:MAG: fibronectin type III domain-containing protein [Verrucomicrobiota bacterium]|nr:fibronectin type III domain-containing protein [Verrucomicrobiota bacterium]
MPAIFAEFSAWLEKYQAAPGNEEKRQLAHEGARLAEARRSAFKNLILTDPERALAEAVPEHIRRQLPAIVLARLEQPVNAKGDYNVIAVLPHEGQILTEPPIQRSAEVEGTTYRVHTFAQGLTRPSRENVPIHGVALDEDLALNPKPYRVLAKEEIAVRKAEEKLEAICPVSGKDTASTGQEAAIDVGGEIQFVCHGGHILAAAEDAEDIAGISAADDGPVAEAIVTGEKSYLFIRVRYSDSSPTSTPQTDASSNQLVIDMANFLAENSFGRMSLIATVSPTFTLPNTQSFYTSAGYIRLRDDARNVATQNGYNPANYNYWCVRYNGGPGSFAGLAVINGPWSLVKTSSYGVAAHEWGHNGGGRHSNFHQTSDGSAVGPGTNQEYGDIYSMLGSTENNMRRHFSTYLKNVYGWLPASNIFSVGSAGTAGTYRIHAHDLGGLDPSLRYALKVYKDSTRDYWLEFRQHSGWSGNRWVLNGLTVRWDPWTSSNGGTSLIDTTPGSASGKNDAAVVLGRTFSDPIHDIHFTPIAKNGTAPPSMDVVFRRGPFPNNQPPDAYLTASNYYPGVGEPVTLVAGGFDPDGDPLAYYWELDDTAIRPSVDTITKSWTTVGVRTVYCTISDMKGQTIVVAANIDVGGLAVPSAPTDLAATAASSTQIDLSWTDNSANETGFEIWRVTGEAWEYVTEVGADVTSYSDTWLAPGTTYSYYIWALNAAGYSDGSNEASATTQSAGVAEAPTALIATTVSSSQIDLSWTDNSANETGFEIWRVLGEAWEYVTHVGADVTSYSDAGLAPGTIYSYYAWAFSAAGYSDPSNDASATTGP